MSCTMCGCSDMRYKETVTFSTGRTADVYVCPKCGFAVRVYH